MVTIGSEISTTGTRPISGKIRKITTGRLGLLAISKKQKRLPIEKIGLPIDIANNRRFPDGGDLCLKGQCMATWEHLKILNITCM